MMLFLARDTQPRARSCFRAVFMDLGGNCSAGTPLWKVGITGTNNMRARHGQENR